MATSDSAEAKKRAIAAKKATQTMSTKELNKLSSREFGKAGNAKADYWVNKGLMSQQAMDALKADIAANGVREPLMLDKTARGTSLINGHHRLAIANELGIKRLPVSGLNSIVGPLGWLPTLLEGGKAFTAKKPPRQMY